MSNTGSFPRSETRAYFSQISARSMQKTICENVALLSHECHLYYENQRIIMPNRWPKTQKWCIISNSCRHFTAVSAHMARLRVLQDGKPRGGKTDQPGLSPHGPGKGNCKTNPQASSHR